MLGLRPLSPASTAFPRRPAAAASGRSSATPCYLSHVCPLEYDLLFERFLDESRWKRPISTSTSARTAAARSSDYVKEKYGEANVAQIGTFGTLAARAAIRDVGRALGMPIARVDQIVAMVPEQLGITLDEALETSDELKQAYDTDAEVRELLDLARKIEGLARNVGTHAAAVVIADQPLDEYVPLRRVKGKTDSHHAVGDGRRRSGRPLEDGLPRPAEPDDPRPRPSS